MYRKHTSASMAKEVIKVLSRTNTTNQLLGLTYNNASNNSVLLQLLEENLKEQNLT
jgi:hypothetical protein